MKSKVSATNQYLVEKIEIFYVFSFMLRERQFRFRRADLPELDTNFNPTEVFVFSIIGFIFATRGKRVKAQKFNLKDRTKTLNDYFQPNILTHFLKFYLRQHDIHWNFPENEFVL